MSPIKGYPEPQSGGGAADDAEYILNTGHASLPNGRELKPGANVNFDITSSTLTVNAQATGGGAPSTATYITFSTEPSLSAERRLANGTYISLVDGGANSTVTIDIDTAFLAIPFLTLGAVTGLTAERSLQVSGGLTIQDGGANSTLNISASAFQQPLYLVLAGDANLANERIFVPGTNLTPVDAGAGGNYTLNVSGVAQNTESFLVLGNSSGLSAERKFVVGTGLASVDAGVNSTFTVSATASSFGIITSTGETPVQSFTPTGSLAIEPGTGIDVVLTPGTVTVVNTLPNVDQQMFTTYAVGGWPNVTPDSTTDTLTFEGTDGVSIGTKPGSDTLVFSVSSVTAASLDAAPDTAQYLTLATSGALDNERVLTPSRGLSAVDSGAGAAYTLSNISSSFHLIKVQGQTDIEAYLLHDQVGFIPGTGIALTTSGSSITVTCTVTDTDAQNLFYNHAVSGWPTITPDSVTDTLTYQGTDGVSIGTVPGTDTLVFSTSSITAASLDAAPDTAQYITLATSGALDNERVLTPSRGLSAVDGGAGGAYTLSNTTSSFHFVKVQGQSDIEAYQLQDQFGFISGTGITLTVSGSSITVTNSSPNASQNLYNTYATTGWASISPDSPTDTLNLVGTNGISIGLTTDTITFSGSGITAASLDAAPDVAQYLTLATSAALDNERVFTPSRGLSATDGGANGAYTLNNTSSSIHVIKVAGQTDVEAFQLHDQVALVTGPNTTITTSGSSITIGTTGLALTSEPYVTIGNTSGLSAERGLAVGTGLSITDGGANSSVTLANTGSSFGKVAVSGQTTLDADALIDTLNMVAGTLIALTTDVNTDTVTITGTGAPADPSFLTLGTNSGLSAERVFTPSRGLSAVDGGANGAYTVSNTSSSFGLIKVVGQTDVTAYLLQDQFGLVAGSNTTITTSGSSITIASSGGGNSFGTITTSGFGDAVADQSNDVLIVVGTDGVFVGTTPSSDTLTVSGSGLQPLDGTLTALAALNNTAGFLGQTGADTFVRRTLTGTANRITITNPTSTAADPVFDVGSSVALVGTTTTLTANATGTVGNTYILNPVGGSFTFTLPTPTAELGIFVKMASALGGNTATIGLQFTHTVDWDVTSIVASNPREGWNFYGDGSTATNWVLK